MNEKTSKSFGNGMKLKNRVKMVKKIAKHVRSRQDVIKHFKYVSTLFREANICNI